MSCDPQELQALYSTLAHYLQLEEKLQPRLCLATDQDGDDVTIGARDGAAHILRCLKVWFDLSTEVFLHAVNLFDRFLTKMKVRPSHIPCLTIACMNIALDYQAEHSKEERRVSTDDLIKISQTRCTARDVERMSGVVVNKLSLADGPVSLNALHWLRCFLPLYQMYCPSIITPEMESELINLLEMAACEYSCSNVRASALAFVMLAGRLERLELDEMDAHALYELGAHLQSVCHISIQSQHVAAVAVGAAAARYERGGRGARGRWPLSDRTAKVLRPTDRLTSLLPTIQEQHCPTSHVL